MMVNSHHKTVLQPTPASTTVSCLLTHIIPPPTSLIYPERFNSSKQATASGADNYADIIGTDIQQLPNLPCISPSIKCISKSPPVSSSTAVADIWINMESNDESNAHANISTDI